MSRPFETVHLESASAFLDHLAPNGPLFGNKDLRTFASGLGDPSWIFRGVDNAEYPLLPLSLREGQSLLLTGGWKPLSPPIPTVIRPAPNSLRF